MCRYLMTDELIKDQMNTLYNSNLLTQISVVEKIDSFRYVLKVYNLPDLF